MTPSICRRRPLRSGMRCPTCSSATRCGTAIRPHSSTAAERTRTASRSSRARWSAGACSSTWPATRASTVSTTGNPITVADLDGTAHAQRVEVRRADFVIVRTGQMEDRLRKGEWGGYAGGPAPGLAFETLDWIHGRQIAGICSDTWGIEVRPNDTEPDVFQPWHWVTIPAIGIVHGEIFYLEELAADCAADRVYEFFFCAPPLVITRGTGSPINPQAIK